MRDEGWGVGVGSGGLFWFLCFSRKNHIVASVTAIYSSSGRGVEDVWPQY